MTNAGRIRIEVLRHNYHGPHGGKHTARLPLQKWAETTNCGLLRPRHG
jgi:hypothetical protein